MYAMIQYYTLWNEANDHAKVWYKLVAIRANTLKQPKNWYNILIGMCTSGRPR